MKKSIAFFLASLTFVSMSALTLNGCAGNTTASTKASAVQTNKFTASKIAPIVFLPSPATESSTPTTQAPAETIEPTLTPSAIPSISPSISSEPTSTAITDTTINPATQSQAIDSGLFHGLTFGDNVATIVSREGDQGSFSNDGIEDSVTYTDVSAFGATTGTLRYVLSDTGKLTRIQYAFRLSDIENATNTPLNDMSTLLNSVAPVATPTFLTHTWPLLDYRADNGQILLTQLLNSELAKTSDIQLDPENPSLIWPDGMILNTELSTQSTIAVSPVATPTATNHYLPSTTLTPVSPSTITPTPSITPSIVAPSLITDTVAQQNNIYNQLVDTMKLYPQLWDEMTLALSHGAHLNYAWTEQATTVVSFRLNATGEDIKSDNFFVIVNVTPDASSLSEEIQTVLNSDVNNQTQQSEIIADIFTAGTTPYTTDELVSQFDSNAFLAQNTLKNKGVVVTGEIASIDTNEQGDPIIRFVNPNYNHFTPTFIFTDADADALLRLKKGDHVQITGIYLEHTDNAISFNFCSLN